MADHNELLPPVSVSTSKEKVWPDPLPAVPVVVPAHDDDDDDDDIIKPPMAVMPADNNKTTTTTTTIPPWIGLIVCLWALYNAVVFAALNMATLLLYGTPCTKSRWPLRCVVLSDDVAVAELRLLLCGELLCSMAAALAVPMLLTTTTTSRRRVLLLWVALAATVGMHSMKVASERIIFLAAHPADVVVSYYGSVCLAADLLFAGVLLCYSSRHRRRLETEDEHQT